MTASVQFVVIDDTGVWHERPRVDMRLVTRAIRPVPAWIERRGGEGSGYDVTGGVIGGKVDGLYRQIIREGYVQRQAEIADDTGFEARVVMAEYTNYPGKNADAAMAVCRRIRDMQRMVWQCPRSSLSDMYDMLVIEHKRLSRLAALAIVANSGAMALGAEAAKMACWNRLVNET